MSKTKIDKDELDYREKIKKLKVKPKKKEFLKEKNRISLVESMDNPWVSRQQSIFDSIKHNSAVLGNSSFIPKETKKKATTNSDSDDEFEPEINTSIKKIDNTKINKDMQFDGLKVCAIPTAKDILNQRLLMKENVIPRGFGTYNIIIGSIGSGKSNLLAYLMLNPLCYFGYFDQTFLLTNSNDDIYDTLVEKGALKKSNIKHQPDESDIQKILDLQKKKIKEANGDYSKIPLTCVILDDVIDDQKFVKSKAFRTLAIRPRQYYLCVFLLSQYMNSIPKQSRMQSQNIFCFSGTNLDSEIYADMLCPANLTKKQFHGLMEYAWTKTDDDPYPFLYINRKCGEDKRYRKNLLEFIDINKFK